MERIRAADFARAGEALHGTIAVRQFERLRDALANQDGEVRYALRGMLTERGDDAIALEVSATLSLACQRCLEPVIMEVQASRRIVFAPDPHSLEAAYDEAPDTDVVEAVEWLDVAQLVEDEVLLSLPYSPRHPPEACTTAVDGQTAEKPSPFAVLAKLPRNASPN